MYDDADFTSSQKEMFTSLMQFQVDFIRTSIELTHVCNAHIRLLSDKETDNMSGTFLLSYCHLFSGGCFGYCPEYICVAHEGEKKKKTLHLRGSLVQFSGNPFTKIDVWLLEKKQKNMQILDA